MEAHTAHRWGLLSKVLKTIGGVSCVLIFTCLLGVIVVYSSSRPHTPQPERGWTVGLTWTHPTSYGTAQEERLLLWLHWWFFPAFGLIALGEAIKIYKLDDYSGIAAFKPRPFSKPD